MSARRYSNICCLILQVCIVAGICFCTVLSARADDPLKEKKTSKGWSIKTEFGRIGFCINPESTQVSDLMVNIEGYECGKICIKGDMQVSNRGMWPVVDNCFKAQTNLGIYKIVFSGMLDRNGEYASGVWEIHSLGDVCSGSWNTD